MENELYHYGIRGMHWGIRRYQNKDGTYTAKGRERYNKDGSYKLGVNSRYNVKRSQATNKASNTGINKKSIEKTDYGSSVAYKYRANNKNGRNNFDKIANRKGITVNEISEKITGPMLRAARIFTQERKSDVGMEKAAASLAKDLGNLDFAMNFERYNDGFATGMLNIIGNDRYYSCLFEDDYIVDEGLYDSRTNDPIEGVW